MIKLLRSTFSLLVLLIICTTLTGQSPYELSLKKDLILFGGGAIGQVGSIILSAEIDNFSAEELELLNANDINSFDRRATKYYSLRAQKNSDILLNSSFFYPLLFLIDDKGRNGFLEIGVLTLESFLVNASITSLTKVAVERTRPFAYNSDAPLDKRIKANSKLSFFSGHTSSTAVLSFFSAKVFSDYYPDSKWKPVVWTVGAIIPAATGYLRVRGGKHFPTDVIVGYAVGAIIGVGIPHIHKKKSKDQRVGFSLSAGGNSVGLTMKW